MEGAKILKREIKNISKSAADAEARFGWFALHQQMQGPGTAARLRASATPGISADPRPPRRPSAAPLHCPSRSQEIVSRATRIYHLNGFEIISLGSQVQIKSHRTFWLPARTSVRGASAFQRRELPLCPPSPRRSSCSIPATPSPGAGAGLYSHLGDIVDLGAPLRHGEGDDAWRRLHAPDPPGAAAAGRGAAQRAPPGAQHQAAQAPQPRQAGPQPSSPPERHDAPAHSSAASTSSTYRHCRGARMRRLRNRGRAPRGRGSQGLTAAAQEALRSGGTRRYCGRDRKG